MKLAPVLLLGAATAVAAPVVVLNQTVEAVSRVVRLNGVRAGSAYSIEVSVPTLAAFEPQSQLKVSLQSGGRAVVEKILHAGDADLYATFEPPGDGAQLHLDAIMPLGAGARCRVRVVAWPRSDLVEREPNDDWRQANQIQLGATVFASADDLPYIPLGDPRRTLFDQGVDWYRFDFDGAAPKLVYFALDLTERDNIPVDVSVWRVTDGRAVVHHEGEDPVALPHEVQALAGNKFTTRVLRQPGAYYVRVAANHPVYKLRTRVYDAPPYADPRKAVRATVDYVIGAGDSWHANTPRKGGVFDRVSSVHQETSLCVACHATHFPQRAQLYAARQGYGVNFRQQLQFLTERFYNNPRPLYGFEKEGAVWARVISAPANVLGRMSHLLDVFEKEVTGERRERYHRGVAEYLRLYYHGRDKLPADETNGNTPLVSGYEVAWYAWEVTRDTKIAALVEQDEIKNLNDLAYQTLALAAIDPSRHAGRLKSNAARLLSLQRPTGQWAMRFEPEQPEAEFATGLALWALHAAGVGADHAQVRRGIDYLLQRQQAFGGWHDPLQSYENFRTPFRESQMAVLALSAYFPEDRRGRGWNSAAPSRLSDDLRLLTELDRAWDPPSPATLGQIERAADSPDALVRQQAVEALGRLANPRTLRTLVGRLGDSSKLVARTAAWAVRQIYSRHPDTPLAPLLASLRSGSDRTRWGATRVFTTHFAELAQRSELAVELARLSADPTPSIRMHAVKALWQFWYWSPDDSARGMIEDALIAALGQTQHPWVERNLREAVYNLGDENIRYLYNNWVPVLARAEDRERVIRGRLALEARLAGKFARVLDQGSDHQRRQLLAALAEFHLRRGDVYDLKADLRSPAPPVYNRIGNDVEQTVFFGASNDRMARAIEPLMASPDPETRRLAWSAALVTRDVKFADVSRLAGPPQGDRDRLTAFLFKNQPESLPVLRAMGRAPEAPGAATKKAAARPTGANRPPRPDEGYFRGYVQPILETRGKDGSACVHCHATHTIFTGSLQTALNTVDLDNPEQSLLLRKPTSSAETEGTLGSATLSHGGGVRWEKDSPEYNTILNWIRGVKP